MVVISVSLSGKELREFDELVKRLGYSSRSDAVRDALHKFLAQHRFLQRIESKSYLLISIVYDEKKMHHVLNVIHEYTDIIHSSSHSHFNDKCSDQLVLTGDAKRIEAMLSKLSAIKDVRVCNCIV